MADPIDIEAQWTPEMMAKAKKAGREVDKAMARVRANAGPVDPWWESWKINVPRYEHNGVSIQRFTVTAEQAYLDQLRAAFNPQRPDRTVQPGEYTSLTVDGNLWMTDTPAEIRDLWGVDQAMHEYGGNGLMLIVGLGLGVVLQRAIVHRHVTWIDVVESDGRIIDAVGSHYYDLAAQHGVSLHIHEADIHAWKRPIPWWDIGWFDIWFSIDSDDMPEVKLLRDRFRRHLGWFGAWAQQDRVAQKRRLKTGKWAY